jgi:ABC-type sugar transport system substrate-binding protein
MMSKLLTMLTAAVLALTLSGFAAAAERDQNSQQTQDRQRADPAVGGATVSQHDQDYLVALKKCESLTGADKSRCIDAAKKKNGQM